MTYSVTKENKQKKLVIGITAEGSVNLLIGQLEYFKSLGYETYLLAPYSERSAKFCKDEGCIHLIVDIDREINLFNDFKTLRKLIKIFRKVGPDIINLGTPKISLLGMIAGSIVGVQRKIYTCRGFRFENELGYKRKLLVGMEKVTAFFSDTIICISPSLKSYALSEGIFNEEKTYVIHKGSSNGLNLDRFSSENINKVRQMVFLQENNLTNKFVFGFVGRLVHDKGVFDLLTAFERIYEENKNIRLVLLGSDITANAEEKKRLEKYNNHPAILFLGFQEDVPFYMSTFDAMVLPSHREGFGNVYIQAAALGIACIGCDITGVRDALSHDYNGVLIKPKSQSALYDAMKSFTLNSELVEKFGKNGLIWAKNFDRQIIWDNLNEFYQL